MQARTPAPQKLIKLFLHSFLVCRHEPLRLLMALPQSRRFLPIHTQTLRVNHHPVLLLRSGERHFLAFHIGQYLLRLSLPRISMSTGATDQVRDPLPRLDVEVHVSLAGQFYLFRRRISHILREHAWLTAGKTIGGANRAVRTHHNFSWLQETPLFVDRQRAPVLSWPTAVR